MKKTAALLLFLQIFISCNGQDTKVTYVQKLEYELKGAVKEVTTYIYPLENDKIPANNGNYIGKITMTLDSLGNVITKNKVWDFDRTASTKIDNAEFTSHFFGKGKELSFKETTRSGDGDVNEVEYKYVWLDDHNYTILPPNDDTYSITTTLNKEYQIIKCVYKKGNSIQSTEEWQTISKNNKIQEIKTKATENQKGKKTVSYQIQVVQEYDNYGNPTVIYGYHDLNKQKMKNVLYKEYKYYE